MIRALRIALANWIMPEPVPLTPERTAEIFKEIMARGEPRKNDPPVWLQDDAKVVAAVKTFPGGLTVWPKP